MQAHGVEAGALPDEPDALHPDARDLMGQLAPVADELYALLARVRVRRQRTRAVLDHEGLREVSSPELEQQPYCSHG